MDTVTAHLYVGADNMTGEVDMPVITDILVKRHERGYTVIPGQGCWNGQSEPIVMVVVTGTQQEITDTALILRETLKQEAIGLQYVNPMQFV